MKLYKLARPTLQLTALLMVLPLKAAHAHHVSSMGSAFWHDLVHLFNTGIPLVLVVAAVFAVARFLPKAER